MLRSPTSYTSYLPNEFDHIGVVQHGEDRCLMLQFSRNVQNFIFRQTVTWCFDNNGLTAQESSEKRRA